MAHIDIIRKNLRWILLDLRRMSQAELSRLTGIPYQKINGFIHGRPVSLGPKSIEKIAAALDMTYAELATERAVDGRREVTPKTIGIGTDTPTGVSMDAGFVLQIGRLLERIERRLDQIEKRLDLLENPQPGEANGSP